MVRSFLLPLELILLLILDENRRYTFKAHLVEDARHFINLFKEHKAQRGEKARKVCIRRFSGASYVFNTLCSLKSPSSTANFGEVVILFVEGFTDLADVLNEIKTRYGRQAN